MSRRIDLLPDPRERAALEALLRAQGWAQVAIDKLADNTLDDEAFEGALGEVRAVLAALDALPPQPRKAGQLNAAEVEAQGLGVGAEAIALLAWMPGEATVDIALAATGNRTAAWRSSSDQAAGLTDLVAAAFARSAPAPVEPTPTAVTPEASA